jgi:hypothetical protein
MVKPRTIAFGELRGKDFFISFFILPQKAAFSNLRIERSKMTPKNQNKFKNQKSLLVYQLHFLAMAMVSS